MSSAGYGRTGKRWSLQLLSGLIWYGLFFLLYAMRVQFTSYLFTDREAFLLRTLSNHIDLACYHCTQRQAQAAQPARTLEELTQVYGLTRRETEILGLVFQDRNNEEILEQLHISKNTLLKHLQNLYRKCGVSSRWDLLKLR